MKQLWHFLCLVIKVSSYVFNLSLNTVSSLGGVMSFNHAVNADSLNCGEIEKVKLFKDDDP